PVLAYFRSQHDNQSWLGALTTILDASALVLAGFKRHFFSQARLTFAMARHGVVDLSPVFNTPPRLRTLNRLSPSDLHRLHSLLRSTGLDPDDPQGQRLAKLRGMYEPYVGALAEYLQMELPPWIMAAPQRDNWQTTAWNSERG